MGGCDQQKWNTFRMNAVLTSVFIYMFAGRFLKFSMHLLIDLLNNYLIIFLNHYFVILIMTVFLIDWMYIYVLKCFHY